MADKHPLPICGVDGCTLPMKAERLEVGVLFRCDIAAHSRRVAMLMIPRG